MLGRLWTRLGGNRARIADAQTRQTSLVNAGLQELAMKAVVCDARIELGAMQENADALRVYAAEPLLVGGVIPRKDVARALHEGCRALRMRADGEETAENIFVGGVFYYLAA